MDAPVPAVERAIRRLCADLRTARLRRNLTIAGVREKIGTGPRAVSDAEVGEKIRTRARRAVSDAEQATISTGLVYTALPGAYDLLARWRGGRGPGNGPRL